MPATEAQLTRLDGDKDAYDRDLRPTLMQEAIRQLQGAGVWVDTFERARVVDATDALAGAKA